MSASKPLPKLSDTSISHSVDPNARSAYNLVLAAERTAMLIYDDVKVMHTRVVGFLMIAFHDFRTTLGDQCFNEVSVVVRAATEEQIFELGFYYRERLLRACELHVLSPLCHHPHP